MHEGALRDTLGLDGVEEVQVVEVLVLGVPQRRHGQRLQVEQLGGQRVLLGQNEVAEGDRQLGLGGDPPVADHPDEVLRGQRLKDGHEELDDVFVLDELLLEQEVLVVEDRLIVHVRHPDPEGLPHRKQRVDQPTSCATSSQWFSVKRSLSR